MSELSKSLGNAGVPHTVQCLGRTYTMKLIDQGVKVGFEKRLYQHAKDAVTGLRHDMDSSDYVGMLSALTEAYEAGDFAMEGRRGRKAMNSPRGSLLLLSLLMGIDEAEAVQVMACEDAPVLVETLTAVMKESFPGLKVKEPAAEVSDGPKG